MLRNAKLIQLGILVASIAVVNGCSSKNKASYDMSTQEIMQNGCLNLGALYSNLQKMPGDGVVRAFTYDFSAADQDEDGNTPGSARLRVLNRAAYFYSESKLTDLRTTWVGAAQDQCSSGALYDSFGNASPFTVVDHKDNWIEVKLSDDSTERFQLTGTRSLHITAHETRMSQCIFDAPLETTTEVALRWGPKSQMPEGESVSAAYMRALSQSVPNAPAALTESVADVETDSISLASTVLASMNDMQVSNNDQNYCAKGGGTAPDAPPLPTPTPSPTPTPTPQPSATPDASATPSPSATP